MFRLMSRVRCLLITISLIGTMSWSMPVASAEDQASAAQLAALLRTIDPYRPQSQVTGNIRVFGSPSMDALAHGWAEGFAYFQPGARVEIHGAPDTAALAKLLEAPESIAMVSRPITEEELADLKQRGLKNPMALAVAREALAVFVNSANPVSDAPGETIREIFTTCVPPENLMWKTLGATGALASQPIHILSRTPKCGTQRYLKEFIFQDYEMRKAQGEYPSNAQVLEAVSQDPLAIAICGMRSTGGKVKKLQLSIQGEAVPSDDHAVLTGQYPFTRPLTLVLDMGQTGPGARASQEFVRYALCRAGQSQTIVVGYFPVDIPLLRAEIEKLAAVPLR